MPQWIHLDDIVLVTFIVAFTWAVAQWVFGLVATLFEAFFKAVMGLFGNQESKKTEKTDIFRR